jgi:hypothetical protein
VRGNILSPSEAVSKYPNALWIIDSDIHRSSMLKDLDIINIEEKNIIKKTFPKKKNYLHKL